MVQAGYSAPNIAKNVSIAHGVRLFFQRDTGTSWLCLGDITDLSVNPVAEFVEHFSNHDGQNALSKRILQNKSMTIDATLNEINDENLQLMLLGGTYATGSVNYLYQETLTAVDGGPWTTAETMIASSVVVKLEDGTLVGSGDYTALSKTITDSGTAMTGITKINVQYTVALTGARQTELLNDTNITGAVQFHILNNAGGVAQIYEFDSCFISPNGSISLPADGIQTLPLTITTLIKNNKIGRSYFKNA